MTKVIENKKEQLIALCKKYKVSELDVFGSAAAGDFDPARSDIDFLVEFQKTVIHDRFDNFFNLLNDLKQLFGRDVDLVEPGGMKNPYFIEMVNQTKRKFYVAPQS
ncbi:MAG: nucleotidyltransferase domain-containing protein [Phycisphaerae bacterium]|nr:nucleotidyltransferase domain-containing protein [Phycisphaerae bacterium]